MSRGLIYVETLPFLMLLHLNSPSAPQPSLLEYSCSSQDCSKVLHTHPPANAFPAIRLENHSS